MENQNVWFEEITTFLFKKYKEAILKNYEQSPETKIQRLFLLMDGVILGYDPENDTAEGTDEQYFLGLYTKEQVKELKPERYYWKTHMIVETGYWHPEWDASLWNVQSPILSKFDEFQDCAVLAYVGYLLKIDLEIEYILEEDADIMVDVRYEYPTPVFRTHIPDMKIKNKIIDFFAQKEEHKEYLLSLWSEKPFGIGQKVLSALLNKTSTAYPLTEDFIHNISIAVNTRKKKGDLAAITILENFLHDITSIPQENEREDEIIQEAMAKHAIACNILGEYYLERKKYDQVEKWWRKSSEINRYGDGSLNLCRYYELYRPNHSALLELAKILVALPNPDRFFYSHVLKYLASGYLFTDKKKEALEIFKKILKMASEGEGAYKSNIREILEIGKRRKWVQQNVYDEILNLFE